MPNQPRTTNPLRLAIMLCTLCVSAWLCARGATYLLASSLLPASSEQPFPPPASRGPTEEHWQELARTALSHNIFDSETGPMPWDAPRAVPPPVISAKGEDAVAMDGNPEPCQASLRLVGSFVVPPRPALSLASIEAQGKTSIYRTGMQVEGHDLVGIRGHRVFMRPAGRALCQLAMFRPPQRTYPETPGGTVESVPPGPPNQGDLSQDEPSRGISQLGDTQYRVARSLLEKVLGNPGELMRKARVILLEENGRVIGMKIYGVHRTSVLGRLGIQNGDLLRTINGIDLTSPDAALAAYTQLRGSNRFTLSTLRRGEPRRIEYVVD